MSDEKQKKLSTEPYKGVRDFYPEDQAIQNYIFSVWRKVSESYGYEDYSASILEPSELYRNKTSDEIVNEQTYTFIDRGEREVTLRPEMTPTVARLVAGRRRELAFPVRWYSIQNFFRYERPQRGRVREFWQLNADVFGVESIEADIEAISLAYNIVKAFGASDDTFKIRVNNRAYLQRTLQSVLKDSSMLPQVMRLIDRKAKISDEVFATEWKAFSDHPFDLGECTEVDAVLNVLKERGITNAIYDPSLVRGFDYYTGTVFEIFDTDPANSRSIFGGGRYDRLLELFSDEKIPAMGFAIGDVTMRDFLETHGLLPHHASTTEVMICPIDESAVSAAQTLAAQLRAAYVSVAVYLGNKKIGDQIKTADKKKIPFIIVVGEKEAAEGVYTLKHLATGKEYSQDVSGIAQTIRENK